jgi:hypothetical protein
MLLIVMTTAVQYIYYLQTVTCALLHTFSSKPSLKKINITHSPANIQHLDTVISKLYDSQFDNEHKGTEIEITSYHTFLGSIITGDGYDHKEINRRLSIG